MLPPDCPAWEYADHPLRDPVLKQGIKSLLIALRNGGVDTLETVSDTRNIHFQLFFKLTPDGFPYYAGHYRGDKYRCLKHYEVTIKSDPRVGCTARTVHGRMDELTDFLKGTVAALDEGMKLPNAQISLANKIEYLVVAVCKIFELLLRIHPYANGNGHMARFCVWALLGRYGLWPKNWPIDPRPDPPYTNLIVSYRNGNPSPLECFIMSTLTY